MGNLRISLLGPGDIEAHFYELMGFSKNRFESEIESIAKTLANENIEIELLPDKGTSLEIAKKYKDYGGKKVIATIPKSDKDFGIKHLKESIETKINKKPLFDEKINTGDWYKHDLTKGLFGNAILYMGIAPGSEIEFDGATYIYKLIKGLKKYIETPAEKIHPELKAGKETSLKMLIYSPFIKSGKLSEEIEFYLNKYEIPFYYIHNSKELKEKLQEIKNNPSN